MRLIYYLVIFLLCISWTTPHYEEDSLITYTADPAKIQLFWKDSEDQHLRSIGRLESWITSQHKKLIFATNGGMYESDGTPVGLFIQNGKVVEPLNKKEVLKNGSSIPNFYLKPNGVFYIDKAGKAFVTETNKFNLSNQIQWATQSGPMLVVNRAIHSVFQKGSPNQVIRSGVGILPNGKVLFAISRSPINFYDFALYFQQQGCANALFLDGFVSRIYLPEKGVRQTDGNFGVIVGVTE
ncbi:phosphodiester glycosidase family protein [Cytophagaceae bacterium DM2B3-1]|uniref:Phosphodiester glycosidase family protein n=1 Tax=Xanthocytophaga flava TaxID=3048013 RepID=A0ABT7CSE5_9BACT|nr:phosphodiester glycosidase family protein [Xanthocytophaga flavus]MDJ1496683.1 phosphodiester glycosidase family protein [Xanthocytophaga flavus]